MSPLRTPSARLDRKLLAALFVVYVVWGSTFLAMRIAIETLPPLLMAALRHGTAGLILLGVALARGARLPSRREWASGAAIGLLILGVGNASVAYAEQWVPSSLAAMIFAAIPLLASLVGGLFGKWPSRGEWLALILGLGGVLLISRQAAVENVAGMGLLLAGAMGTALGVVLTPRLPRAPGLMGVAVQLLSAGAVVGVVSFVHGDRIPANLSAASLGALAYLIVFGSVIAYAAYSHLLATAPPALATSNNFVNPVVAALLGATLAGEALGAVSLAGMALVLAALATLLPMKSRKPPPIAAPAELHNSLC